jgi:hypothetical protein
MRFPARNALLKETTCTGTGCPQLLEVRDENRVSALRDAMKIGSFMPRGEEDDTSCRLNLVKGDRSAISFMTGQEDAQRHAFVAE